MKAYLIDAEKQTIDEVEIGAMDDIVRLVGYETIESDAVGDAGDRLFFDEECFLRGSSGRFQIDTVIPVSGKAILIGSHDNGTALADVRTDLGDLHTRLKYL